MTPYRLFTAFALLALTALSTFHFPGVTWLQSDTQIYVPIFEHINDNTVLARDPVAIHPHVSWTLYDETAILARRWFAMDFRVSLGIVQFLTRLAGISGVFLIARSLALSGWASLLIAACFALGAIINGPAVLTMEYEPVPRGFAIQLVFGALGLVACQRWALAGVAGTLAMLFHPPTSAPFWACLLLYWLFAGERKTVRPAIFALTAGIALATAARLLQHGEVERQAIFGRIDPFLEQVQRIRGAYNWIELWPTEWLLQYPLLFAVAALAWWRLQNGFTRPLAWFSFALPVYGLLTIPAQWLLLDQWKWIFVPQFQPARAVLFVTAFAVILGAIAGWRAAGRERWLEALAWFFVVFAVPANGVVAPLLGQVFSSPLAQKRMLIVLACGAAAILSSVLEARLGSRMRYGGAGVLLAITVPFLLIPGWGEARVTAQPPAPEIRELAEWAAASTAKDSVFLFADSGRNLAPGVFRSIALRALYVDWKGGGQVNLWRSFARDWRKRWFDQTNQCLPPLKPAAQYQSMGIRYLVLKADTEYSGYPLAYENTMYRVFDLR